MSNQHNFDSIIEELQQKYKSIDQDTEDHLYGLLYSKPITYWDYIQTDALLIDTSEPSIGWEMFFPVLVLYPLVLYIFSKKYNWTNWQEKLLGTVRKPIELDEDKFIA